MFKRGIDPKEAMGIGMREKIKILMKEMKEVGWTYIGDNDALRWASRFGHTDIVKWLIDKGTDIHTINNLALRWASQYGYYDIVKLLLDAGAAVQINDNYPLRIALQKGHTKVANLLKQYGTRK